MFIYILEKELKKLHRKWINCEVQILVGEENSDEDIISRGVQQTAQ